ncbi:MAG TPA: tyrosine-type recombinase/integrase [Planctomycetota bacterium]|nr:tyrosine-type recombinase/integrase [Planctomycetota bacterium]
MSDSRSSDAARPGSTRRRKRSYSRDLRSLALFLWEQGRTLTHATEKDAAAWVRALQKRRAGTGVSRRIAAARGFFEQVGQALNPFARFRTRRSDRPRPAPLGARELKTLMRAMDPGSPWGVRNRAIFMLRFGTPLRLTEICRLQRRHLLLSGKKSVIRVVRKGVVLRIPLRGPLLTSLKRHLQRNPRKGPYLFQPISGTSTRKPLSTGWVSATLRSAQRAAGGKR